MNIQTMVCLNCGYEQPVEVEQRFASRDTNRGNANAKALVHFINTETKYVATSEPSSSQKRASGGRMRPDIKIRHKDKMWPGFMLVERQEQNTSGTGHEKVANKIHKALNALHDHSVLKYFIVLAGARVDLLLRTAKDTLTAGGAYPHERLVVVTEDEFKVLLLNEQL